MRRRVGVLLVGLLAVAACTAAATGAADTGSSSCRTVWAGSETMTQHNGGTFLTFPIHEDATLTHLTGSISFDTRSGPVDTAAELLTLVGASPGPLTMADPLLPVLSPDPAFGPLNVSTPFRHGQNPDLFDGVIAARIVKSNDGAGSALIDEQLDQPLTAGGTLWVRYDSDSGGVLDPEVQLVATVC